MITEQRIANYVSGLKEVVAELNSTNGYLPTSSQLLIFSKYNISRDLLARAIELGYIKRIGHAKYKCIVIDFHPIYARKIIEKIAENAKAIKHSTIKVTKEKDNSIFIENNTRIPYKPKKNIKTTSITKPVKEKVKVSILWGLFSWSKN